MNTDSEQLFQNLGSLFHELRGATMFLLSACSVLVDKLPKTATVTELLEELANARLKLYKEVDELPHNIDWTSGIKASVNYALGQLNGKKLHQT